MSYNQGDIVLVPFPFTDQSDLKTRPAIIISNSRVNDSNDVICVQQTTQESTGELVSEISSLHVDEPFRPPHHHQYVICRKVLVIEKNKIIRKINSVNDDKLREIIETVQLAIEYGV